MPFKKGQSGNPQGRAISIARRLAEAGVAPSEAVYIPILDKRDPAKELIKLADSHSDKRFKMEIWMYLFGMKYKASKIMAKPAAIAEDDAASDAEMLRQLEGDGKASQSKPEIKGLESKPNALQKNVEDADKS